MPQHGPSSGGELFNLAGELFMMNPGFADFEALSIQITRQIPVKRMQNLTCFEHHFHLG
jgi:hypothetical protein